MSIKIVIAVTDHNWFEFLRRRRDLDEVNFWAPSTTNFRALNPGEFLLFKLRQPYHAIVGGGVFLRATDLPCSLAWDVFREANGTESAQALRTCIARYRRTDPNDRSDFRIGCRILTQPFFFEEPDWIPLPKSWKPNIVSLKTYNTDDAEGMTLWANLNDRLHRTPLPIANDIDSRFGEPQLIKPRLGQGAFRISIQELYHRRCAITKERTLPALDAAHIRPYSDGGKHEEKNGLLLRRDIHSLFDGGYVTVTPDLHFEVSPRIKEEFENGRDYYKLHGAKIVRPSKSAFHPDPALLRWHNDHCFRR